jgi:hypothetical protein
MMPQTEGSLRPNSGVFRVLPIDGKEFPIIECS